MFIIYLCIGSAEKRQFNGHGVELLNTIKMKKIARITCNNFIWKMSPVKVMMETDCWLLYHLSQSVSNLAIQYANICLNLYFNCTGIVNR
jgi:hypothetical protein